MQPSQDQPGQYAPIPVEEPVAPAENQQLGLDWQASEYIHREKNQLWFVGLGLITLVLLAVAIFLVKDYIFALLVVVMAVAIVVFARRPVHDMQYQLNYSTITVNGKSFSLRDFRAFGVLKDDAVYSISLLPVKRFAPSVNVHFPPEYGEQIVDMLGASLPMEEIEPDLVDIVTKKLGF